MTAADTSIQTYYNEDLQKRFATQRELVFYIVSQAHHPSAADIARISNLKINAVTGRLNELEKAGLICKAETKKVDPFTHQTVNWYAVAKGESQ